MLTSKRLSIEEAEILMRGAADEARRMGIPMCIAVTDDSGQLIRFDRMDGGKISSISIAIAPCGPPKPRNAVLLCVFVRPE